MDTLNPSSLGADLNRRRTQYDTSLHTEADQSVSDFKQLLEKATATATQARLNSGIQVATADNQIIDQTDLNHEQAERLYGQLIEIRAKLSKDWQQLQRAEQAIFNFRASLEYAHQELRPHNTKEGTRRAAQNRRFEDIRQANLEYMAQQHPEMMTLHRGLLLELARIQVAMEVVDQRLDALNKQLGSNVEPLRQPSRVERYAKVVAEVAAIAALLVMIYEYLPILTNDANKALAAEVDGNADDDSSSALYELEGACVGLEEASDDLGGIIDDLPDLGNFGFSLDPDFDAKVTKAYESACEEEGIEPGDLGKIDFEGAKNPQTGERQSSREVMTLEQFPVTQDILDLIIAEGGPLPESGKTYKLGERTVASFIADAQPSPLLDRLSFQQQMLAAIRQATAPNIAGDAHIEMFIAPTPDGGAVANTFVRIDREFVIVTGPAATDRVVFSPDSIILDQDLFLDQYLNKYVSPLTGQIRPNTQINVIKVDQSVWQKLQGAVVDENFQPVPAPALNSWVVVEQDPDGSFLQLVLGGTNGDSGIVYRFPKLFSETPNGQRANVRREPSLAGVILGQDSQFEVVSTQTMTPEQVAAATGVSDAVVTGGIYTKRADNQTWQLVKFADGFGWVSQDVSGVPQEVIPAGTPSAPLAKPAELGAQPAGNSTSPENITRETAIANFAEAMETMPSTYFTYDASGNVNRVSLTGAETLTSFGGDLFIMANGQEVLRWSETSGWLIPQFKTNRTEVYLDYDFTGPKNEGYSAMDQDFVFQIKPVNSGAELQGLPQAEYLNMDDWVVDIRGSGNSELLLSRNPQSGSDIIDTSLETLFAMLVQKSGQPDVQGALNSTSTVQTSFSQTPWDISKRSMIILGRNPENGADWRGGIVGNPPDNSFTVRPDGTGVFYDAVFQIDAWSFASRFAGNLDAIATKEEIPGSMGTDHGVNSYEAILQTVLPVVDGKVILPVLVGERTSDNSNEPVTFGLFQ